MALINCPECNKQISDKAEICVGCGAPVIKGFKIGNLEVAQDDFPTKMLWGDAKKACEALGKGWRLPNKDELNTLYENKDAIGGFMDSPYWCSSEYSDIFVCLQKFDDGEQSFGSMERGTFYVRAVRNF